LLLILVLSSAPFALSQIPQGFNYQAVARDASGLPILNHSLPVRMTIQSDSSGGTIFWQELHSSVITTDQGVINLIIGKGARQSLSTVATFSAIDWSVTPRFLKIEIDYSGWKTLGVSRLWSVPYAMVARVLEGPVKKLAVEGETSGLEEALFEVKNKDGQTVFAVYNEGVRVYVSDGAKAVKGGFAVGGFGTDKAESTKYLFVGKDSVRIYLDTNPLTKALKSGFAVGGYDLTKGVIQDYLKVNSDSVRIYIDKNPATKKVKGGFAVGGFDATKGPINNYMALTPENYLIGENSGAKMTTGLFNSFMGYEAGKENTEGMSNVIIGHQAGTRNTIGGSNMFIGKNSGFFNINGNNNIFLGDFSGYSNTGGVQTLMGSSNIFIGSNAGYGNTTGCQNIFIGTSAGHVNSTGSLNIFIGYVAGFNSTGVRNTYIGSNSGENNTTGDDNIFIGNQTGQNSTTGTCNTIIGSNAGWQNGSGSDNVYLGTSTGRFNNSGNYNVFLGSKVGLAQASNKNIYIGYQAGTDNNADGNIMIGFQSGKTEINSNRLYIENSESDKYNALIYGEFDTDILMMNAAVKIRDLLNLKPRAIAPSNPEEGDVYYDSNQHKLMVWNGTDWMACW
ncbi:MAG: hypothetical protein NT092_13625, partial [Bacteroidia bacterium]|nr:hypothetical protein [Bacteroidia bacterium]